MVVAALVCALPVACAEKPVQPSVANLPTGRWAGDGACLSVAPEACDLVAGCGHGAFPPPTLRADGTFDVEGTYRIEAGPISMEPAPPATFSGVLSGKRLTLTVTPRDSQVPPATYGLQLTDVAGNCVVPCV
jgi:hypothetical protein